MPSQPRPRAEVEPSIHARQLVHAQTLPQAKDRYRRTGPSLRCTAHVPSQFATDVSRRGAAGATSSCMLRSQPEPRTRDQTARTDLYDRSCAVNCCLMASEYHLADDGGRPGAARGPPILRGYPICLAFALRATEPPHATTTTTGGPRGSHHPHLRREQIFPPKALSSCPAVLLAIASRCCQFA
jgi:hypothetical protein